MITAHSLIFCIILIYYHKVRNKAVLKNITAIILAGGKSARMKDNKLLLPINDFPLIQHVYNQAKVYFSEIIISSNSISKYSFIDAKIIKDKVPDCGPLMGIASAMEHSSNDINFVIAGDIPEIDIDLLFTMVKQCKNFDGVMPMNSKNQYEPLFAIYRKKMLNIMFKNIADRKYKITDSLENFKIKYIKLKNTDKLININDIDDYNNYINDKLL